MDSSVQHPVKYDLWDVFYIYLLYLTISFFVGAFINIFDINISDSSLLSIVFHMIPQLITLLVLLGIIRIKYKVSIIDNLYLSLRPQRIIKLFYWFSLSFGMIFVAMILLNTLFMPDQDIAVKPYLEYNLNQKISLVLLGVLWAPLFEETMFRGFLFNVMISKLGVPAGIFLTSFIFAICHFQYIFEGSFVLLASMFLLSVILCLTRNFSESLYPCILAHLFNNLFAAIPLLK